MRVSFLFLLGRLATANVSRGARPMQPGEAQLVMLNEILSKEPVIRLGIFLGVFGWMAVWE